MIGDVNLFFKRVDDDEEECSPGSRPYNEVECEVMIAGMTFRISRLLRRT